MESQAFCNMFVWKVGSSILRQRLALMSITLIIPTQNKDDENMTYWHLEQNWQILSHDWQEYNPELTHHITKKEKSKKGDGVMLTNITTADQPQAEERER